MNTITVWAKCSCNTEVEIEVHTLSGETKCLHCGHKDQLGQTELLALLMNLED